MPIVVNGQVVSSRKELEELFQTDGQKESE
jgi:hypothetical protein